MSLSISLATFAEAPYLCFMCADIRDANCRCSLFDMRILLSLKIILTHKQHFANTKIEWDSTVVGLNAWVALCLVQFPRFVQQNVVLFSKLICWNEVTFCSKILYLHTIKLRLNHLFVCLAG